MCYLSQIIPIFVNVAIFTRMLIHIHYITDVNKRNLKYPTPPKRNNLPRTIPDKKCPVIDEKPTEKPTYSDRS